MDGKVKVNGNVIKELGTKIGKKDIIEFDEKIIGKMKKTKVYILLNKPIGYVTTVKDQFKRDTVMDLLKEVRERIVPVGRLDMYTSGALILSNDGQFINQITHPSHEIDKTYQVTIRDKIGEEEIRKLEQGVNIEGYITKPAKVRILKTDPMKQIQRVEITIHEGKNRQVRKMFAAIGKKVIALHRSKIGNLTVRNLEIGKYRYLSESEVNKLLMKK